MPESNFAAAVTAAARVVARIEVKRRKKRKELDELDQSTCWSSCSATRKSARS